MTAVFTDAGILEALDFDPVLACEHSNHNITHSPDDPAMFLVRFRCPECGGGPSNGRDYLLCLSGWEFMLIAGLAHRSGCGADHIARDDCMTILKVIGGRR